MRRAGLVVLLGLALGVLRGAGLAQAHGVSASYSDIIVTPKQLEVGYLFSISDIFNHFPVNANGDERITRQELDDAIPDIVAFLTAHLTLTVNGVAASLALESHRTSSYSNGEFVELDFSQPLTRQPVELVLTADEAFFERFGPQYTNLVKVSVGEQVQQAVLSSDHPREAFVVGHRSWAAQCAEFITMGIKHIFLGYDHIMFLFALIILGGRLGQLVKIVTAFTIAHSMTLILAALQVVTLPSRLIESGIALSIAYVALENFFVTTTAHRWLLTFFFGLVHGFGFANVLREMGLPTRGLVPSLLSFNLGVEIGQLAIVAVLFPVTLWLAKQRFRRQVVLAASGVIFLFGVGWFIQRAFGLSFMPI